MERVKVYATTIHDKNANSFKLSHDRFPSYLILFHSTFLVFTSMINKPRLFPEICLTTE